MNYILDELDPLERVQEAAPRKYKENCTLAMTKIDTVEEHQVHVNFKGPRVIFDMVANINSYNTHQELEIIYWILNERIHTSDNWSRINKSRPA